MATRNLGQAAIVSKGAYSSGQAYVLLNTVTHRGGSFMCIAPCQGIEPGVSSNWQSYWVATAKGIVQISITSDTEGIATLTITFSDNTTYSHEYETAALPDGSVGTAKLIDGSVTSEKIAANAVTREKLATDALYSPVVVMSDAQYSITADDGGKTFRVGQATQFVINSTTSPTLPSGFEIAIIRYGTDFDVSILFDGVPVCADGARYTSSVRPTVKISDSYSMIAIKKITAADTWLVTGNVEVVS